MFNLFRNNLEEMKKLVDTAEKEADTKKAQIKATKALRAFYKLVNTPITEEGGTLNKLKFELDKHSKSADTLKESLSFMRTSTGKYISIHAKKARETLEIMKDQLGEIEKTTIELLEKEKKEEKG